MKDFPPSNLFDLDPSVILENKPNLYSFSKKCSPIKKDKIEMVFW